MAPSQTLPESYAQDSLRFSPSAITQPIEERDEGEGEWQRTIKPTALDPAGVRSGGPSLLPQRSIENINTSNISGTSASLSPRVQTPGARLAQLGATERGVDSKLPSYGHHRQTSIVHGIGIQHSRNGSLASSSSSPISPQALAAAGAGQSVDMAFRRADNDAGSLVSGAPSIMSGPTLVSPQQIVEGSQSIPQRQKLERMNSAKSRRDHGDHHTRSHSRQHKEEQNTVGEYALHVLLTSFHAQAEEKLNECITVPFDPEPQIDSICGVGVDPSFDQSIVALGHIAKERPKPLIDWMMHWRKGKSEAANEARSQVQQPKGNLPGGSLVRRNTEPVPPQTTTSGSGTSPPTSEMSLAARQEHAAQAERRSTVAIYILCRVLLEVIKQSTLASISPEMEDKLEGLIFFQLKITDTEQLLLSPLKLSNWNLFTQLLGAMSGINFRGVADRFIGDLDRALVEAAGKTPAFSSRDVEGRMELVLGGMKHLRIQTSPPEAWDRSCDFMIAMGKLFSRSHGQKVKSAFCQVLEMLLLPIAAKASNAELSRPKWTEALLSISPRLAQMFVKPRHWTSTFPLTATLLCVATPENFLSQWLQIILPLQPKLKDRMTKPLCLQVISRLLWTYLYRSSESPANTTRKLDEVVKLVLPPGRRSFSAIDTAVTDPLIQIIRIIGYKHPDYCFRTLVFPLVNAEYFGTTRDLKIDHLDPDRTVLGIQGFLAVITDLAKGEAGRPPFPDYYATQTTAADRTPTSPVLASPRSPSFPEPVLATRNGEAIEPIRLAMLSEPVRDYFSRFCEILGKITMICDNTFGGQAALDEKFNSPGVKTPITETFNFTRRDEHPSPYEQKQAFLELLHVAVQALPRCLSPDMPFNSLINLLCTGTAHVQHAIAVSSASSLKAIAKQSHAQQVTMGFARFIFNFDDRYATMSDGGMLGPGHIESTLRLYVELLHIWIEEIRQKTQSLVTGTGGDAGMRAIKMDLNSIWAEVDQVEARALFFLCSQARRVRYHAISVLRLIKEFDTVRDKSAGRQTPTLRLIDILDNESVQVMNFNDEQLSVAERSRLQRGMQKSNNQGTLIELCTSDVTYDTTLWFKIFPNLIRVAFEKCPFAISIARDLVCNRILQMYKTITMISEPTRGLHYGSDLGSGRLTGRTPTTQPDVLVEQWRLYLVFACTTLADGGPVPTATAAGSQHGRKGSKASSGSDKIVSARILFKYLNPLLSASSTSVREAVVTAMGSINIHIYRTLLEELQGLVSRCNDEARARMHQRTNSSPRRNRKIDLLRTEVTHVYRLTSHFLKQPDVYLDEWVIGNLMAYARDLKLFLMDGEVQLDWEFQKLRRHYCGLMEELFEGLNRTGDPSRWMTFEARKSAFTLMEEWCGFSPNQNQIRQREDSMRQSMIDQQGVMDRGTSSTAAMEREKRNLRTAALSAMASLCAGPLTVNTKSGASLSFDVRRMLAWIDSIFSSGVDRLIIIGRKALKNLVVHNQEFPYLLEHCISRCYLADSPRVMESYFTVTAEVLLDFPNYPLPFWKSLGLCLFTLGSEQSEIRSKSAQVFQALEERQGQPRSSKIQDYAISMSDKTKAVYKLAQSEISRRLAKQRTDLAFHIFAESALYFKDLQPASQQNLIGVVLPWVQLIELKLDPNGGPVVQSYALLANLLEITIKAGAALHNEIQALWQALATGPHPGNVRLVLDFIMSLCLERREQNFVEYAKQIVVFLSTASGTPDNKVVEYLLLQITPRAMVPHERRETGPLVPDTNALPYCADLSEVLPVGTKQAGFSLGQLSLILLVDLVVAPANLAADTVPLLLQVVTVLWDHYTPLVQEQAQEMLVHLIHELVISQTGDDTPVMARRSVQNLIDLIRRKHPSVIWGYEDNNGKIGNQNSKIPPSMDFLTYEMVKAFEVSYPGIKDRWSRLSLTWAVSCPVRHLACRSFQIFRCILTSLDQHMLSDMLIRLSNTIADEDPDVQTFAMEIVMTLKTLIIKLEPEKLLSLPQLFWTTCACLDSINELEFLEGVEMLNELLDKLDFQSSSVRRLLMDGQPPRWEGNFEGVQPLLYKGLRSSLCLDLTLTTFDKLVQLPNDPLIGHVDRLFFTILGNLPRFARALERSPLDPNVVQSADVMMEMADSQGLQKIGLVLDAFTSSKHRAASDFLGQMLSALREYFLPELDFKMISMLMGMLTNNLSWVKINTMRILCIIIPEVDMRKPEMASHGSDLISPLLRLLQSDFCMEALEVLDKIMTMSGSSLDRQHLRMSMTRGSSRTVRKEFERTQSLFGIPEDSGWAIPVPAKRTDSTRANIHAAFYMCQSDADGASTDATPTPEVEFHAEEFPYGYFPPSERTDTMMSDDIRGDGPMGGDLVSKLDSLDDFFDDLSTTSPPSDGRSSRTITEFSPDNFESGAQLYDEHILPILHQASNNVSFQNGFADRPAAVVPPNVAMNPGAFMASGLPAAGLHRPTMHSRSITSPSAPASYHPHLTSGDVTSDEEYVSDVFSDDEDDRERPGTSGGPGESSTFLDNIRPFQGGGGVQARMPRPRRLTGSRGPKAAAEEREKLMAAAISPQVPKVPTSFLTGVQKGQGSQQQQQQQPQGSDML